MLKQVLPTYKDILNNCLIPTLVKQFRKEPHVGVHKHLGIQRTFGHVLYNR